MKKLAKPMNDTFFSLKTLYYADDLARINDTESVVDQQEKVNGVCMLKKRIHYEQGALAGMTLAQYNQMKVWAERYTDAYGAGLFEF